MGEVSNSFFDKLLSGDVVLSLVEEKALGPSLGRGSAFDRFDPNAWDGDGDGLVQEGTPFERPAIPGINTDLPNVPKVPQVSVSNNKEVRIYDEISGSSRSMRAGINTARFPRLKRRNKRNPDLDIPQIIKEKTGTVDDGEANKRLSIQLKNLESQFSRGVITVEEYNMQRLVSLSEYNYERSIEQSATKAGIEIPREISGIGATGEDGNVVGFVNLIRFSSMHNGIRYLHNSGDDEMLPGTELNETDQYVGRRYPGELRTEEARTLEDMNEEYEELLQQLRDGRGWDAPLEVSIGFSFEQEIEILRESAGSQLTNQSFKNELYLENEEIPKYLAGIAYSMERALSEQVGGENFEGKIDIAVADRIAKLLSKSWVMKDSYKKLNPHWGEIYDFNMIDIFSPADGIPGLPYFHPSGLGELGKNLDTAFMFPFDKDGADIPVVIKRGLRVHEQRTFLTGGKELVLTRYFFDTHRPEVFETEVIDNPRTSGEGKRPSNDRKLRWEFFPNTEQPKFQVGKIEGPVSKSMGVTLLLDRNTRYGAGSSMDLRVFPFRITQDGIPYRFEPSFSIDEQPAIKRINEFLKKIGIPETRASNTDSLYVPSEFDPRYLVVNGPLETPGKTEERPKSYLDRLRESAARDRGESADLETDVDMARALLKKQSIRQTDDEETVSVWVPEELVADNASIDASRREPQTPPSITPPKQDMAQRIREGKIRKNLGLSDDEEIPPEYGGDNSRSKRENKLTPVKTTLKPDKRIIFTGNDRKLNDDDWEAEEDDDELGIFGSDGDGWDLIAWEDEHPDVNVYISEGKSTLTGEKVRLIAIRHKLAGESSESQGLFISFEISEPIFNKLSSIINTQKEIPESISDGINKLLTRHLKNIEDLARFAPEKSFRDLGHIHFTAGKLKKKENVVGMAMNRLEGVERQFVAIRYDTPESKLITSIFGDEPDSSMYGVLSHEFGHVVDTFLPETPESKKLQKERSDLAERANKMLREGKTEEFLRLRGMVDAIRIPRRLSLRDSEEWKSAVAEDAKHITRRQRAFNSLLKKGVIQRLNHDKTLNYVESSTSVTKYGGKNSREDFADSIALYFLDLLNEGLYLYSRKDEDGEPRDELRVIGFQYLFPNRHKFLVEHFKKIEDADSTSSDSDSSKSIRNTNISTGDFIGDEEIDPDLKYYINDSNGFPVLRHPLVYAVPYMPQLNNMYNRQYLAKKEQLANALDTGDWDGYVYLHERPYRLDALLEISDDVDDATFWSLLSGIWTDSENIRQNQEIWNEIFDSGRDGMENMMKDEERDALAALPKKIKIYQGHTGDRDDGWSWTTDEKVALWFALRFSTMEGSEAQVTEATVDKDNVLAYLLGRGESEILTSPEDVVIDVTESAKDFQERTGTPNTYDDRSLSKKLNSSVVDSLTVSEFIDDFNQNDKDSSKLAESLGIDSTEPVDKLIHNLVNLGLIKDVPSFDSSRSKRSDNKSANKERALKRFMMLSDDEVVALFKENDGSGTKVRVSLGNPNEKEFYARIEEMKKRDIIFAERKVKKKNDENVGSSSRSKKEIYSFTPESDIAEQIKDRKEVKKKASKEIGRITASTRKREEIREITSRIEEKVKSLSDITDSSALSEREDEIDALSIELQSMLNNITSFISTNRGKFKPYVSVYGRTAFSDEPSSSYLEIRLDYLTESAESGSWPGRTMYGDLYIASDGEKFIRKSVSRDDSVHLATEIIHVDTEQYFDAFQNSIFSAMGVKKFRREATSPKGIFYSALDGLHWADEVSKEDFLKAVEWISKQKSIEMSTDKRKELARLIKIARSQKLDSPNAFKPEIFLRDYDAIDAIRAYQRAEFEGNTDDMYMRIDFTGDTISPDDIRDDGYYFGESSDGGSRSKRKKISLERRKKLTAEAEKLSAPYRPSTRKREEIRAKMDEVRNNVKYYKKNPEELNDFIYDIFTRDLKPDEDLEEQFIINLDGKDYELFFGTDVSFNSRTGNLEITLVRIPEGAVDEESVLRPGVYKIQIDDNGNMTTVKEVAEIGDMAPSLVMLRGEGELENFTKLNKAMNLVEESILSAMGIDSFIQNATAYRGESGRMRTGISLSLAEGRTFADEEGKEIFLKIIDSITKNTEIDSDTRARLKALHDRAKKNNLGVNNAVQPQDFVQGSLSENYDLEKGIRDFLDDEKNGMRMLSIDFVKKIDGPDVYRFGGDSSRSERDSPSPKGFISPEEFKRQKEKAEREYWRYSPSSAQLREFERITKEISAMLADIKDEDDEVKFFDSELLNELRDLLQSSFGKYLYGDEVIKLEFMPNGYLGFNNQFIFPIVATTVSPSLGRGYPSNIRNIVFGTMYINSDGNISFSAKESHGHITDSMGETSASSLIYREFMNINNRSKQLARDEVFTENIIKAIGAKSVRKIFTSNRYFPPYSGDGDGIYGDGITFAAEQDYYWGDENQKEIFLDLIQKIIDSTENTSRVNEETKKRLLKLVLKSRKEEFGKPNTVRPKDLIRGYDSRDEIFWAEYGRDLDARNRGGSVSIFFAVDVKPTSDDSYYFGGDSSRSKRSLEIVEFNAPTPSKKQIKAIDELKNIVSDDRKDSRLFSDEEGNVPKQIFDGSFEINGEKYSSQIDRSNLFVSQVTDGSVEKTFKFSGKVLDKDGNEVASFSRGIKFVDGRPVYVTHDGFYIRYASQNIGISTALNARNEKLYREMGMPKILINPATSSGDGKVRGITHWLRNGYSWDDSASRKLILDIIDKALTEGAIKDKEQESAVRKIRESIRENIANLNDDINLEDLVNWDGADEWFMSYADSNDEYERGKTLYANLSKNLISTNPSVVNLENSSRSKSTAVPVAISKNGNFLKIKYGDFDFDIRNPEPTDNNWANAYEKLLSWEGSYYSRIISSALLGLEPPMAHGGKGPKAKLAEAASAGSSKGLSNFDIVDFRQAIYDAFISMQRVRDSRPTVRPLYRGMVVENDSSIVDASVGDTFSMPLTSFTYVELGAKEFAGGSFNSPESIEGTPILVVLEKGAKAADSPNGSDMFPDGYLDSIDDGDGGLVRVPMESVTQGKFKIVSKERAVLPAGEGWEIRIEQLDTYEPLGSRSSRQTNPPVPGWAREADISRPIKEMSSLSDGESGVDSSGKSSRSEKYSQIAERINAATRAIEDDYQIIQVETEKEMNDLRSIWKKSKKEVESLKKEIADSKDTNDMKDFNMTYKRFKEASRMIDKALDPNYLSPYNRSRADQSQVEHFAIHDGGLYGGIFGGVASVRWAPQTETIYIDFMGSTPLLMPGIGAALYGKILKWGRDMGAKKYVSGALPGSLGFWEEMGMVSSDEYGFVFKDSGLVPMVYEDSEIGMIEELN